MKNVLERLKLLKRTQEKQKIEMALWQQKNWDSEKTQAHLANQYLKKI